MPPLDTDHVLSCVGGESNLKEDGGAQCGIIASARADGAGSVPLRPRDGLAQLFGAALRRDGSTKGSSNPKAAAEASRKGAPRAGSWMSPPASVVIGALSAGKVVAHRCAPGRGRGWRRPAAGARVFASEAVGAEPVSPKVSCFGAVLPETPGKPEGEERSGCWASVAAALRGVLCSDGPHICESGARVVDPDAAVAAVLSPPQPVPGLGDVKRLASRRWPETMAAQGRGSV